jgi:pimeloyl-ACP methyl ester carboxylesterase
MLKFIFIAFIVATISCKTESNKQSTSLEYGSNTAVGKYIPIDDVKLYYEVYGEGQPLILLHGNGSSIGSFSNQIPALSSKYKVYAIDSRAQGRSSDSIKDLSYKLMADDIASFIKTLSLSNVNIVGWSDGGNIGIELAFAYPELVNKVVTIGANYNHENFLAEVDRFEMEKDDPLIVKTADWVRLNHNSLERLSSNPAKLPIIRKKLAKLMDKYPNFTADSLKRIQTPFLVIASDHDIITIDHSVSLYKHLPNAYLFIVPNASHLSLAEFPNLINGEIIRFLDNPYRRIDKYYFLK